MVQSVQLTSRPSSSFTTLCRGQVQTSNLQEEGGRGEGEGERGEGRGGREGGGERGKGGGKGGGRGDRGVNLVSGYPTQFIACV